MTSVHLQAIKYHHTLGILLVWLSFQSFFCYIPLWRTSRSHCGMQIGLLINSHLINLNHHTANANRLKFLPFPRRVQQKNWEEETIMRCEHLRRRVLHMCAASKVSASYFYSCNIWLIIKGLPFAELPCMQNFRSPPLGTNNAFG